MNNVWPYIGPRPHRASPAKSQATRPTHTSPHHARGPRAPGAWGGTAAAAELWDTL
jgi:hypothetical protein